MIGSIVILTVFLALILPGFPLVCALIPRTSWSIRLGLGAAAGLSLALGKSLLFHELGLFEHPSALAAIEGAFVLFAFGSWFFLGYRASGPKVNLREAFALAGIVGCASLLRMVPHRFEPIPLPVSDAPAHATITTALILNPGEASWRPFMDAVLHYPWASHSLLAEIHLLTGVPVHGVFSVLLTAGVGGASILILTALAELLWGSRQIALGSAFAYGFLSLALGVTYSRWGGLPAEIAFALLLALVAAVLLAGRGLWLVPLLTLGILITNHLTAGICMWVVGWCLGAAALAAPGLRLRCLGTTGLMLLGSLFALPMWIQVLSVNYVRETHAFSLLRQYDLMSMGGSHIGTFIVVLAALGLLAPAKPSRLGRLILLAWIAALLTAFAGLFTATKLITGLAGEARIALEPSRWAVALTYPLAIFAGGGGVALWERLGGARYGAFVALTISALYPLWQLSLNRVDPDEVRAYEEAGRISAPGDLIVAMTPNAPFAGAWTRRQTTLVPSPPGSDPMTSEAIELQGLPGLVRQGLLPPASLLSSRQRRFYIVGSRSEQFSPSVFQRLGDFGEFVVGRWSADTLWEQTGVTTQVPPEWTVLPPGTVFGNQRHPLVWERGFYAQEALGNGWGVRWTDGDAEVRVIIDQSAPPRMLRAQLKEFRPGGTQLRLLVNGQIIFEGQIRGDWDQSLLLPEASIASGRVLRIQLRSETFVPSILLGNSADTRTLGVMVAGLRLLVPGEGSPGDSIAD